MLKTSQEKPAPLIIHGVQVDLPALQRLAHRCDPALCRHTGNCCTKYEVLLDAHEIPVIVGVAPHAAHHAKDLVQQGEFVDFFDDTPDGPCLSTHEDGTCVFAYRRVKRLLCSLHTAALDLDLPPAEIKPRSCSLWPLGLSEDIPPILTVQRDILEFPCNRIRKPPPRRLDPGVAGIIQALFGAPFLATLRENL